MKQAMALVVSLCFAAGSIAQQTTPLSGQQEKIKQRVNGLKSGAAISVTSLQGPEEFGRYVSSDGQTLTFYDVDQKQNVTLAFAEVKKLKEGYGGYNTVRHRHTGHTKAIVVILLVAGALGGLIAAAAASK